MNSILWFSSPLPFFLFLSLALLWGGRRDVSCTEAAGGGSDAGLLCLCGPRLPCDQVAVTLWCPKWTASLCIFWPHLASPWASRLLQEHTHIPDTPGLLSPAGVHLPWRDLQLEGTLSLPTTSDHTSMLSLPCALVAQGKSPALKLSWQPVWEEDASLPFLLPPTNYGLFLSEWPLFPQHGFLLSPTSPVKLLNRKGHQTRETSGCFFHPFCFSSRLRCSSAWITYHRAPAFIKVVVPEKP